GLVEARGRLVEEQELGWVHRRPGQLHHPGDADRQRPRVRGAMVDEAAQLEHLVHPGAALALATGSRRRAEDVGGAAATPRPPRHSRAVSTLSSTVSQPKVCTRWNVRRRPRWARWATPIALTSRPSSVTRPRWGRCTPEITSNRVVFPAPLGPMSP